MLMTTVIYLMSCYNVFSAHKCWFKKKKKAITLRKMVYWANRT